MAPDTEMYFGIFNQLGTATKVCFLKIPLESSESVAKNYKPEPEPKRWDQNQNSNVTSTK